MSQTTRYLHMSPKQTATKGLKLWDGQGGSQTTRHRQLSPEPAATKSFCWSLILKQAGAPSPAANRTTPHTCVSSETVARGGLDTLRAPLCDRQRNTRENRDKCQIDWTQSIWWGRIVICAEIRSGSDLEKGARRDGPPAAGQMTAPRDTLAVR
ncbi:hypothetical protein J6590_047569 [Homalodisca vitripennis]|nr:hypothetical protein J6590_047569 [Homalodisca vitripennis]